VRDVREDRARDAREWERDRTAWNLPRTPREPGAADTSHVGNGAATVAGGAPRAADGTIQTLPEDISELDRDELRKASDTRDARLSILFRRWPSLTGTELTEIRKLHDERQRLARCIGILRKRRSGGSRAAEGRLPAR
jgi:hypothetical protein